MKDIFLSRRFMLKSAMASLTLAACSDTAVIEEGGSPGAPAQMDIGLYLTLFEDDRVVFATPNAEMGQGTFDALARIIADEMDVRWDQVEVVLSGENAAMKNPLLFGQVTGNSEAVRGYGPILRKAGAAFRFLMRQAAAARLGVGVEGASTRDGVVNLGSEKIRYGDLLQEASDLPLPQDAPLKTPDEFRLIGKSFKRKETRPKTDGTAIFGIDVDLPGMLIAALAMPPQAWGAVKTPEGLDAVSQREGVIAVTPVAGGYAIIADDFWTAKTAAETLTVEADLKADAALSTADVERAVRKAALSDGAEAILYKPSSDDQDLAASRAATSQAMSAASEQKQFLYKVPMLAHGALEPLTATAWLKEDGTLELWVPHQSPRSAKAAAVKTAGLEPSVVTLNRTFLGGGFGRKWHTDFVVQAVQAAMAVPGRPVKLIWTREQDTQHDFYRPLLYGAVNVGLNEDGNIAAFSSAVAGQSLGRKWYSRYNPQSKDNSLQNTPGYALPVSHLETRPVDLPVPIGWWRSVSHMPTMFFVESAMDELARAQGRDPFEYRLSHLEDPRARAVLERLRGLIPADNTGTIGIAYSDAYKGHLAAAVSIDLTGDQLTVRDVWAVADVGLAIDPDNVRNQITGGILYGLGPALDGQVTLERAAVQGENLADIGALSPYGAPRVHVELIDNPTAPPAGVGEAGTPVIAPALCNAIAAAGGPRIRELPISASSISVQV